MAESDVYRRQILTYKDGLRAERVDPRQCVHHMFHYPDDM